jgi:hypothetical protein
MRLQQRLDRLPQGIIHSAGRIQVSLALDRRGDIQGIQKQFVRARVPTSHDFASIPRVDGGREETSSTL